MNCQECHDYIDAYVDNELDVATTILAKQHLRDCVRCQRLLEARKAVGAFLANPQVRFEVPDSLLGNTFWMSPRPISIRSNPGSTESLNFRHPFVILPTKASV
jgi:hypothetical protein